MSELMGIATAGLAAMFAATCTHPIEVVKTRLQMVGEKGRATQNSYNGIGGTIKVILKNEGVSGFYKGVAAAWMRESVYSSLRLGLYEPFKNIIVGKDTKNVPFWKKLIAGSASGLVGSALGNPADVLKTRMMASEGSNLGVAHHAADIYKHQGVGGFYRGVQATVSRAMILNSVKLASYDEIKQNLKRFGLKEGIFQQFIAATCAGFLMSCACTPFDFARTRLMNQPQDQKIYNGLFDLFIKTVKNEGPLALYKGFFPVWGRFAPTTTIQLITWEFLRKQCGMKGI